MIIQRTIPIKLEQDVDLQTTLECFAKAKNIASQYCDNKSQKPLNRTELHDIAYKKLKDTGITSQLACNVIRAVAAAYVTREKEYKRRVKRAKTKKRDIPIKNPNPIIFTRESALFLIGIRGRDARFTKDGYISISTVSGRKKISYSINKNMLERFHSAVTFDSLTVINDNGILRGKLTLSLEIPDSKGTNPVGVDLNATKLIVAVNREDGEFIYDGTNLKTQNKRSRQVRKRLQKKLALLKAEGSDTHSVRRSLKRLGRTISNRTTNECRVAAKHLLDWVPDDSVIILEDLDIERASKRDYKNSKTGRRKKNEFPYKKLRVAISSKAELYGVSVEFVNPAFTSQKCNSCGKLGIRSLSKFSCDCGYSADSDVNAARNIRDRFVVVRCDGVQSITPEARLCGQAVAL
jgi:putative transposase